MFGFFNVKDCLYILNFQSIWRLRCGVMTTRSFLLFTSRLWRASSSASRLVSTREKMINWLVSQHLTTNRHWLSNSVFVTEGQILPSAGLDTSLQQYGTEVASTELVQTLLSDLELGSEVSAEILARYSGGKESIISIAFSILGQQSQG